MSRKGAKKLVLVSIIFTSMTEDSEKTSLVIAKKLEQVMYIHYPIVFSDGVTQDGSALDFMSALLDLNSEVNVIHPPFAKKLDLVM